MIESRVWFVPVPDYLAAKFTLSDDLYLEFRLVHPVFWRLSNFGATVIAGPGSPGTLAGMFMHPMDQQ